MSAITPESYIKLVRFDVTKENQITFADGVAQVDYFRNELQGIVLEASSYQRKDYKVRFPAGIDLIEKYNYMIVQNKPYNYKYYFYYITDMTYINDEMTEVQIKLDVFQTYQFDFTYKKCFVEREHVNSDLIGEHTVPEGLETGEYYVDSYEYYDNFDDTVLVVLANRQVNATAQTDSTVVKGKSKNLFTIVRNLVVGYLDYYDYDTTYIHPPKFYYTLMMQESANFELYTLRSLGEKRQVSSRCLRHTLLNLYRWQEKQ